MAHHLFRIVIGRTTAEPNQVNILAPRPLLLAPCPLLKVLNDAGCNVMGTFH
jgi:hypothetical protein